MTREEAIEMLERSGDYVGLLPCEFWCKENSICEALDMAIEALQRENAELNGYCHRIKPKGGDTK